MTVLDQNASIPTAKLTQYLLIPLPRDDKSQFLARAGYSLENWQQLEQDLKEQILLLEAVPTIASKFGQKYEIYGDLTGPNGVTLKVTTVWIVNSQTTKFVTLIPRK
jgi:hypothetical protein